MIGRSSELEDELVIDGFDVDANPENMDEDEAARYYESDEWNEYKALAKFAEEAANYASDWEHGATLIEDSHFEDYARELASDIGALSDSNAWPATCIDWEKAGERAPDGLYSNRSRVQRNDLHLLGSVRRAAWNSR